MPAAVAAAGAARGAAAGPAAGAGQGASAAAGAAAGRGAPGGRGGAAAPPQPPVVLTRNGREYTVTATNVRAGTEMKLTTERPSVALNLTELDRGSWVIFERPGFTTAASGTPQESLDALRQASASSYYKGPDALWVKVVSNGDAGNGAPGGGTIVQVSR